MNKYFLFSSAFVVGFSITSSIKSIDAPAVTLQSKKQKEASMTELKENIGLLYDDIMAACSSLLCCYSEMLKLTPQCNNTISVLLSDNAELQNSISKQVKLLIENQKPYKKATRLQLTAKISSLKSCKAELAGQRAGWEDKIKQLKGFPKKIEQSDLSSFGLSCHNELSRIHKSSLFTEESV